MSVCDHPMCKMKQCRRRTRLPPENFHTLQSGRVPAGVLSSRHCGRAHLFTLRHMLKCDHHRAISHNGTFQLAFISR